MDAAIRQPPDVCGANEPDQHGGGQDGTVPSGAATLVPVGAPAAARERHAVTVADGDYAIEVAGDLVAKAEAGRITIEALQSITLKVGQSSITIDQTGITIRGLMIDVEGALQTGVKSLRTEIKGTGLLQLGGGLTMIG
jgi:hypothetical protein